MRFSLTFLLLALCPISAVTPVAEAEPLCVVWAGDPPDKCDNDKKQAAGNAGKGAAPAAGTKQRAPAAKTEQWAPAVRTEQWAPEVRTDKWAPEVHTEVREPADLPQPAGAQPRKTHTIDGKKLVWVNWQGQPYQAYILASEGGRHYVTYKGWPSNYDEWISKKSVITEAQAKRIQDKQQKQRPGRGGAAVSDGYKQLERSRELSNRLNNETQQQYRDNERYYDERRRYGY